MSGHSVTLIALPLIFEQLRTAGKQPGDAATRELLEVVKVYNPIPEDETAAYVEALAREYAAYCAKETAS